jgi:hypothetical protein
VRLCLAIQAAKFLKDASAELGFVVCAAPADFGRIMAHPVGDSDTASVGRKDR